MTLSYYNKQAYFYLDQTKKKKRSIGETMRDEKVSLQTSLKRNPSKFSYIFLLDVNCETLTIGLLVFIISSMLTKFQEDQRSITMSSIKWLNFKFL